MENGDQGHEAGNAAYYPRLPAVEESGDHADEYRYILEPLRTVFKASEQPVIPSRGSELAAGDGGRISKQCSAAQDLVHPASSSALKFGPRVAQRTGPA